MRILNIVLKLFYGQKILQMKVLGPPSNVFSTSAYFVNGNT